MKFQQKFVQLSIPPKAFNIILTIHCIRRNVIFDDMLVSMNWQVQQTVVFNKMVFKEIHEAKISCPVGCIQIILKLTVYLINTLKALHFIDPINCTLGTKSGQ